MIGGQTGNGSQAVTRAAGGGIAVGLAAGKIGYPGTLVDRQHLDRACEIVGDGIEQYGTAGGVFQQIGGGFGDYDGELTGGSRVQWERIAQSRGSAPGLAYARGIPNRNGDTCAHMQGRLGYFQRTIETRVP